MADGKGPPQVETHRGVSNPRGGLRWTPGFSTSRSTTDQDSAPRFIPPVGRLAEHGVPHDQHPLRRPRRRARGAPGRAADAAGGRPSLAFVAGESGVGKSRLPPSSTGTRARPARACCGRLRRAGRGRAALRAARRRAAPAGPRRRPGVRRLPRARARRSPRCSPGSARVARPATRPTQARLFEALLALLEPLGRGRAGAAGDRGPPLGRPLDARASSASSRARSATERVLVVATYRPDELHRRHPLRPLLAELERDPRARRVELAALHAATSSPSSSPTSSAPRPTRSCVERLYARSEGNPLFAEELLAAGTDGRGALPPTLRDALMLRIERLSPTAQELLRLLAAGRRLDHELLAEVSGLDAAALRDALREAVAAHIVVALADGTLRVPPRAAARGRPRRPAARRARRAAPALARALEERARPATAARTSPRASPTTTSRPATSRRRWPRPCAPRGPPRASSLRRGARAVRARARAVGPRATTPELAGSDQVELLRRAACAADPRGRPGRARDAAARARSSSSTSGRRAGGRLLELGSASRSWTLRAQDAIEAIAPARSRCCPRTSRARARRLLARHAKG